MSKRVQIHIWKLTAHGPEGKYWAETYAMRAEDLPYGGFIAQGATSERLERITVDSQGLHHQVALNNTRRQQNNSKTLSDKPRNDT